MTYDFHGSWEHNVGENSPLYKGPADQGSMIYFNLVGEGIVTFFPAVNKNTNTHAGLYSLMCRTTP